ncbi:MAG TPA: phosphoribosyltransferase family protein [Deinococcales bacterium]|nr:phosphoribosyltransferase family protein [Deinococcales bacterium]
MTAIERLQQLVDGAPRLADGTVLSGGFLNHRVDATLLLEVGRELAPGLPRADLVLTAEAGGIAPGFALAAALGVPLVFARRAAERVPGDVLQAPVSAGVLLVGREQLTAASRVLLADDILSRGGTPAALAALVRSAGGLPVGLAVMVEKAGGGRARLERLGVPVTAAARLGT